MFGDDLSNVSQVFAFSADRAVIELVMVGHLGRVVGVVTAGGAYRADI